MRRFVTVDVIVELDSGIPLIRRANPPCEGSWAIPGGIVEDDETTERAAVRETYEEIGLRIRSPRLMGVYSDPGRDPRGRSITIVYVARAKGPPRPGSDASAVRVFPTDSLPKRMAFDHERILRDYLSLRRQHDVRKR